MTVAKVGRALAGLTLVVMASACDNNPLAEDRDKASYFRLNPSNVAVEAGGEVKVEANVLNKYGATTGETVTATPCDAKISAEADPERSDFEYPERFIITGNTLGASCLVVTGGGITDTVTVRVIPDSIVVTMADTVLSGETAQIAVTFLDVDGNSVTGMSISDVNFAVAVASAGAVNDGTGMFSARAPANATVTVSLDPMWGATRTGSTPVTVVPGNFAGTVEQITHQGGQVLEFTAGAIPFDADTDVRISTDWGTIVTLNPVSETTAYALLPFGLPAGTELEYAIVNAGPDQVAVGGTITVAATPTDDSYGDTFTTTPVIVPGTDTFGALGAAGDEELFHFTVTEAGSYRLQVDWIDDSDVDVYITDAGANSAFLARETTANPEVGTVTLQPGTYGVYLFMWSQNTDPSDLPMTTYRVRLTRQ